MTRWVTQLLHDEHDSSSFDCGIPSLNSWLQKHACGAQRAGTTRTYVWTFEDDRNIVAYYSITPTQVLRGDVGNAMAGGASVVPGFQIAKLALDRSLHGEGLGTELLHSALTTIVRAAATVGGRLIVVDAVDASASEFYHYHGFHPVVGDPYRLLMKMATARSAVVSPGLVLSTIKGSDLLWCTLTLDDGQEVPVLMSSSEAITLSERLMEDARKAEQGGTGVDLMQAISEVIGRDPIAGQPQS